MVTLLAEALQIGQLSSLKAEGEGFEPSDDVAAVNGFRDRGEMAAMPHQNWSLGSGGMPGE